MLKKNLSRALAMLVCAAAFTFVAAQYPWEVGGAEAAPAGESSSDSPSDEASDESPNSSGDDAGGSPAVAEPAPEAPAAAPAATAAPQRATGGASAFSGSQKTCPVCVSTRIKENLYVDGGGKRIHVCSAACIGRVRRNPSKFIEILEKRGEQLANQ